MFKTFLERLLKPHNVIWYGMLFTSVVLLDRLSKTWALETLAKKDLCIFPGFALSLSINHGISFNMLSTTTAYGTACLIGLISFVFICFITHAIMQYRQNIGLLPEFFVLAGAASNLCDRILHGGVIDFLLLYVANWHWPTFNIADCAIFIGISLIVIRSIRDSKT